MDKLPPKDQWLGLRFYSEIHRFELEITEVYEDKTVKLWNHTLKRDANTRWNITSQWNHEIISPNYHIWI